MSQTDRFSVSLDTELLAAFDGYIAAMGYENRSEAVRDMIRDALLCSRPAESDDRVSVVLTFVCDNRIGEVGSRLRECLVAAQSLIRGTMYSTIDRNRDYVTIVLAGKHRDVQAFTDRIQAMRGVAHGQLATMAPEE